MRRSIYSSFFLLTFAFFLPFKSFAWNALGHMVVAKIAYEYLTPTAKQKVDNLVTYFAQEYPNTPTLLHMAVWPDAVRSQKIDTFTRWHYIDVPFSDDGTKLSDTISTDNAAWALNVIKNVVKNNNANPYERARFLAFAIHIVGDLHQPLHTVTRITAAHPEGDRGGNLFYVGNKRAKMNLHRLWDGGVGAVTDKPNVEHVQAIAKDIEAKYPLIQMEKDANNLNIKDWEKEGMQNATQYVYDIKEGDQVNTAYQTTGEKIAEKELALAGYRLANLLNNLLN